MVPWLDRVRSRFIPPGGDLFSHPVAKAVSSALQRFTTVFGMGTGGSAALEPPGSKSRTSMHLFSQPGKGFGWETCISSHIQDTKSPDPDLLCSSGRKPVTRRDDGADVPRIPALAGTTRDQLIGNRLDGNTLPL